MIKIMKQEIKPGKDYIGVGGGVLIFNKKGKIFLQKRGKNSRNEMGKWEKPGGQIEYGETAIKAMKREIKEETGLQINIWGILPHTDHIIKKANQHWIAFNYLANVKSGIAENKEPHKFDEIGWFGLNKLPKKIAQPTREAINNYKKRKYIKL